MSNTVLLTVRPEQVQNQVGAGQEETTLQDVRCSIRAVGRGEHHTRQNGRNRSDTYQPIDIPMSFCVSTWHGDEVAQKSNHKRPDLHSPRTCLHEYEHASQGKVLKRFILTFSNSRQSL
jgi:hypothetical protein